MPVIIDPRFVKSCRPNAGTPHQVLRLDAGAINYEFFTLGTAAGQDSNTFDTAGAAAAAYASAVSDAQDYTDNAAANLVPNARTVNGHSLSANVTVTKADVGLGNAEDTALSTWAGSANLVTLGTVATGTWNATTIGITKGGTGQVTANAALNALLPTQTGQATKVLTTDGTNTTWAAAGGGGVQIGDSPTWTGQHKFEGLPFRIGPTAAGDTTYLNTAVIRAANIASASANVSILTTDAKNPDVGGSLGLGGVSAGIINNYAVLSGRHDGSNYGGYFKISTPNPTTANHTEAIRIVAATNDLPGQVGIGENSPQTAQLFIKSADPARRVNIVKAAASQSADMVEYRKSDDTVYATVNENGYATTRKNAAPADGELVAGEAAYWFDSTNGAARFMIKAKQANGTVVTGSIPLA